MPSVQMYIKDRPEYAFTGNYYTTNPEENEAVTRTWFEVLKERQPTEAFNDITKGDRVVFVSPVGEAEEMLLINETASHLIFSSHQ
ncbi:hypothetical protein ABU178_10340 [Pantoea osteomyelitidis]|uniref:Uncharacterized protein n=1 Tax=Pantoea osteomyelitidis TaxID=3230026 RepID=A0ABW7PWB4_9GAMM